MSEIGLNLELEAFQGPFDLLLHLIKELEVDINDIPMREITSQYLAYIHQMQELQLDIVGDYLVMAASLLEIKSRLLLPIEPNPNLEDDYEGQDPRQDLVQQLLLYQQFQTVAGQLNEYQEQRQLLLTKEAHDLSQYQTKVPLELGQISIEGLAKAMQLALAKFEDRQPKLRQIHTESVTVEEKVSYIRQLFKQLKVGQEIDFIDCVTQANPSELIATFMAMLEMVRKQELILSQDFLKGPIKISRKEGMQVNVSD